MQTASIRTLPTPNFIVFYNGEKEIDDRGEYRLSDAFEMGVENPALELRVTLEEACDAMGLSLEECREAERIFKERNK